MIKVLGLALYGPMAASTRYRLGQYVPGLAKHGIDLQIHHLLGDEYLRRRFSGRAMPWMNLLRSGWDRLGDLLGPTSYDAAILHCELFPLMPGFVERSLLPRPYIYDFDDAFFLKYSSGKLGIMRPLLGDKFDIVMAEAAAITAGNNVLAEYARGKNTNTHLLPTVVDTRRYGPSQCPRNDVFTIGWIGSPSTAKYLQTIAPALAEVCAGGRARVCLIGSGPVDLPGVPVEVLPWNEATEVGTLQHFDVGIMPLTDDPWAHGKCGFKLIQYMACGLPVVASPVGVNGEIVERGINGLLARTQADWTQALRTLQLDSGLRLSMGNAGRRKVEESYSLQVTGPRLASLLKSVVR